MPVFTKLEGLLYSIYVPTYVQESQGFYFLVQGGAKLHGRGTDAALNLLKQG